MTNRLRFAAVLAWGLWATGPASASPGAPPDPPTRVIARVGDQSVALHWDAPAQGAPTGYYVYRALDTGGPFARVNAQATPLLSCADVYATNGTRLYYQVRAYCDPSQEGP